MNLLSCAHAFGVIAAMALASLQSPSFAQDLCAIPSEANDPQALHINGSTPFVYKTVGDTELRLHVFSSGGLKPGGKRPAVVFFYGGGWIFGDVRRFQTQATHLALRGLVTVLVDYRVKCRNGTTLIDATTDAKSAMRWVRGHAHELGIDTSRIAAVGSSAGGQMAAATALVTEFDDPTDPQVDPKPNALILYNPGLLMASPQAIAALTNSQGKAVADRARDFSPFDNLDKGLPPTIIFQGTADKLIPAGLAEEFCKRARTFKAKVKCEVVNYEGAGHGFTEVWLGLEDPSLGMKTEEWAEDTSRRTDKFLESLGWLSRR